MCYTSYRFIFIQNEVATVVKDDASNAVAGVSTQNTAVTTGDVKEEKTDVIKPQTSNKMVQGHFKWSKLYASLA